MHENCRGARMKIANHTVVGIDYTLTDDTGSVFETTVGSKSLHYVHGVGTMIPGIERAIEGLQPGDSKRILLTPAEGYGQRQRNRVVSIPSRTLQDLPSLRVGMRVQLQFGKKTALFTVMNKDASEIVLDGNHPLAGLNLLINVDIVSVRKATQADIAGLDSANTGKSTDQLFLASQLQEAV